MLRNQAAQSIKQALHTKAILSSILDAVITTDQKANIDYMNGVAENITGWSLEQALGHPLYKVLNLSSLKSGLSVTDIKESLKGRKKASTRGIAVELIGKNKATTMIEYSLSAISTSNYENKGLVVVFRDVTKENRLNQQISWQASHDNLTRLLNRYAFDLKLAQMVKIAKQYDQKHMLLYLDLDQFKIVNDTCGHIAGDELLKQISDLLTQQARHKDVLARLGGDEFAILLIDCAISDGFKVAEGIRKAIQDFRFCWRDKTFCMSISIGMVEINTECENPNYVLGKADTACYVAKDAGRNKIHLYKPKDNEAAQRHGEMNWVSRIQKALDEDFFILYAQQIVATSPKDNNYFEVLIRLEEKEGQIIPPGAFIPAAERYGLIGALDRWVIRKVFHTVQKNRSFFKQKGCKLAINLSGTSLTSDETLKFIIESFNRYQVPASMIRFEITETAAITNLTSANYFIQKIKALGCSLSLDDFGSGLSSFAYLKNLPVDSLKIDGAFVKDMHVDPIDKAMVESINQVGHVMGLKTVAEFVENDEIIKLLKNIGVDYLQGYGVHKPSLFINAKGELNKLLFEM